jgi:hypothetical protein
MATSNLAALVGLTCIAVGEDDELKPMGSELGKKETAGSKPVTYGWAAAMTARGWEDGYRSGLSVMDACYRLGTDAGEETQATSRTRARGGDVG